MYIVINWVVMNDKSKISTNWSIPSIQQKNEGFQHEEYKEEEPRPSKSPVEE